MIIGTRLLCDWVIVMCGARNFLGKPVAAASPGIDLNPVYEYRVAVPPTGGIHRMVVPILFYGHVTSLLINRYDAMLRLNDMPVGEVELLAKAVGECNELMVNLKAAQTGIIAPPQAGPILSP